MYHYAKLLNKIVSEHVCCSKTHLWSSYQIKNYSQYAPFFVEPIFDKEKQNTLFETGEAKNLAHVPFKAPYNFQTCSIFYDERVRKFTNHVMKGGKKALARSIIEKAFENVKRAKLEEYNNASLEVKDQIETRPLKIFHQAIENCRPVLRVTPIKRGGVKYQVPVPVTEKHSYFFAMKWLIEAAQDKHRSIHFPEQLAQELINAAKNQGRVVKRKQDLHKLCEANRAYAHYRWS